MNTPTTIKGHPLHPLLVALPIGLWVFSLVCDIIYLAGWGSAAWETVAFYDLGGGIICALIAAVPGFIDLFSISHPEVKRIGLIHMVTMLITVVIFVISFILRLGQHSAATTFMVSVLGIIVLLIGGWLGAKLVHVFGLTVEDKRAV